MRIKDTKLNRIVFESDSQQEAENFIEDYPEPQNLSIE